MTASQALSALRRALVPALVAAALAMGVVMLLLLTREPTYQARVGIVATPSTPPKDAVADYGSVVSLAMPALPELAVSAPVVREAIAQVPGMTQDLVAQSITVEVVPASGVARVTATGRSSDSATKLLDVVVDQILTSRLLSPVAKFEVIGTVDVIPVQVRPDPLLSVGLGALAAAVVGLLAVAAMQAIRPKLLTLEDVERVVHTVDRTSGAHRRPRERPVVAALGRRKQGLDLLLSRLTEAAPQATHVRSYAADPGDGENLGQLISARLRHGAPPAGPGDTGESELALVTVRLRRTSAEQLTSALLRAQDRHRTVFVVAHTGDAVDNGARVSWDPSEGVSA